jgi:low temperature requirement protein LtrA
MQQTTSPQTPADRVSTLELFFDLVFVFTITQVSDLLLHAHSLVELARPFLLLALIWWMYGGYAWLTNNVGTTRPLNRVLVLTAMAGFLVMALAVPQAFERDGLDFGLAYLLVNVIHAALFTQAPNQSARAIWRIAPFNLGTALLVVLAAILTLALNAALWWSYFAQDDQRAEHALRSVSGGERARMALYAFGYAHLIMIAGIVLLATGIKQVIAQLQVATPFATTALLASGVALYLLGDVLFRRAVRIPSSHLRLDMAAVSLLTIALGMWMGGLVQVGGLLVLFVIMLSWEHAAAKSASREIAQETHVRDRMEVQ